ncbi:MAG: PspC domain-containing protein [Syntrophomonadaceae bacterium]
MKQLRRSRKNAMIAGVAAGLAEYADVDVILVRLIWVLLFFAGGAGFFIYLLCWLMIPENNDEYEGFSATQQPSTQEEASPQPHGGRRNLGLILVGIGLFFLVKNILPWYLWHKTWPLLLVILGLYILFSNRKGDQL